MKLIDADECIWDSPGLSKKEAVFRLKVKGQSQCSVVINNNIEFLRQHGFIRVYVDDTTKRFKRTILVPIITSVEYETYLHTLEEESEERLEKSGISLATWFALNSGSIPLVVGYKGKHKMVIYGHYDKIDTDDPLARETVLGFSNNTVFIDETKRKW